MVAYGIAKARAMANRTDWNERTEITKAVITWFDADYEYELEIENEDRMDNEEFTAWVEENAESLAKADAESLHTVCEEQILAAIAAMQSVQVIAYFQFLLVAGCITGFFTGIAADRVIHFLPKSIFPKPAEKPAKNGKHS